LVGITDAPKEAELGDDERAESPPQSDAKPQPNDRSRKHERRQFPSFFGANASTLGISITASEPNGPKEELLDLFPTERPPPSTSRLTPIEPVLGGETAEEVKRERTTESVLTPESATPVLTSPIDIPNIAQQDETIPFTEPIPELMPQASFYN